MLLFKCVVAAQLILNLCIVGIQLRSSELQIVCSFVSLYLRTLGSGNNKRKYVAGMAITVNVSFSINWFF